MNKYLFLSLLLVTLLNTAGCRRQQLSRSSSSTTTPATDTTLSNRPTTSVPADSLATTPTLTGPDVTRAAVAEIDFLYLTAKLKISFKSQKQEIDNASVNIRVSQDSLIWISVSKLGIEAARTRITRDSIAIMDKIHHEYSVYDFPTLSKQFNFALTFELLQALITGNLPVPDQPFQEVKDGPGYRLLRQNGVQVLVDNYIDPTDRKLKKVVIAQQAAKNTLRLNYDDFAALDNFLFPYSSLMTLDYQSQADGQVYQTVLQTRYNKVELIDKSPGFPFTIPASYQRRP